MDDFSPEEMREFNENLNSMNASLGALNSGLQNLSNTLNQTSQANQEAAKQSEENTKQQTSSTNQKTQSDDKAGEQIKTTAEKMSGALRTATGAVISFSGALVSGVDGFDKYTKAVSGFGDSAKETGDALGGFGKFLGNAVNILTEFTVVTMKQADAQNQFAKEMNRMGAIVDTTTQGLADQARAAGASAGDLQELAVIITQSSQALASFGAGTSEGTAKMLEVFRLSDDQEAEMRRYGYTLREAQEQQAYYIELQRTSGINMQARDMTEQDVRIKSLQYAKTLNTLSELTGIQAGQLKEEQAAVQADLRNKIRNIRDQNDIERLKQQLDGDITAEKRASIEAEIKAREEEIQVRVDAGNQFAGLLGRDMAAKVMNVIGTGAFDENTKELANLGINAAELKERFAGLTAGSDEYKQAVAETTGELVGGVRRNVDRFGRSMELAANASEIGAMVGINERTTDTARLYDSQQQATSRVLESFDKVSEATQEGVDTQKDLAAELQVFETNVRTAADEFLNSMNPFTGGLGLGTIALGGFTIALGTATTALYGMAGSGAGSGILDMFTGGGGKGARGLGAAKNFLTKGVTRFAAPLAAGMSIYSGISEASEGRDQADAQLAQVTDAEDSSMAEIQRAKEQHEIDTKQANRKGAGTAIGGAGGALAGAAAGAAIGSFIPIIGTAIGGIIGGALGAYGGAKGGSALGEALSPEDLKIYESSDAEVMLMSADERKEYDRVVKAIEDQTKAQEAEAERLENVYKENIDVIKENGLYTKKGWLQDSELNRDKLVQLRDDGKLTTEMLEAMLYDNDLSEADQALVQKQLDLMEANAEKDEEKTKKEKDVAEVKEEEVGGRTLDMSPENLAKIFEADIKAEEKRNAEKQAEQLALAQAKEETVTEQITPESVANALKETGSGAPTPEVVNTEKLLATTDVVENMIADAGKAISTPALEEITTTAESVPVGDILKEVEVSTSKVATLIESPAIKKAVDPLDELRNMDNGFGGTLGGMVTEDMVRGGYIAHGQFGSLDPLTGEAPEMERRHFETEEEALRAMAAPQEWEAQLQAKLDANYAEMMAEIDAGSPGTMPVVDITPEPTEEEPSAEVQSGSQLAQSETEGREMTEFEKRSLALQEKQNERLARIENASIETADGTQKIAINSAV